MRQMEALAIHRGRTKRKITREKTDRERVCVCVYIYIYIYMYIYIEDCQ
jgi:hypothetical protein